MKNRNTKQPHVIVCMCDQLRAFEVGCYGNEVIRTPNIDCLGEEGVRMEIACANNPLCTPSRSALLSGQYSRTCAGTLGNVAGTPPARSRVRLTDPTLADVFKAAGYQTALIGKWHIHPDPGIVGFDYALYPNHQHRHTKQTFFENSGPGFTVDGFSPDFEIEQVKRYIREHRNSPFFLFYNISPPHMPLADAPEKYKEMYSPDEVALRENVWGDGQLARDDNWFKIYLWDFLYYQKHLPYTQNLPDGFDLRDMTALYYGLTTWVDDKVGELLNALEESGIADDTLLLFTSDHGDNLGSHGHFNKGLLIEESIRVPMIYRWPAVLDSRHNTTQVASIVDVMPTLLSLVDLEIPKTVQGTELAPVLRGEVKTTGENKAFIETGGWGIGVRSSTHVYGIPMDNPESAGPASPLTDDGHMFHDLRSDPFEFHNLANSGEQSDVALSLRNRLLQWNQETPWKIVTD